VNTQESLPFALTELYVNRYIDPKTKATAEAMVDEISSAFDARLTKLDWMTPATRKEARKKLAKLARNISHPDRWPSYANLEVVRGDVLGNAQRLEQFKWATNLAKLNKPIDRSEWLPYPTYLGDATPNPFQNSIFIGGLMLLLPFFDANADAAANYGGLGATIAHEITHLFDTGGREFDGDGRYRNWWAPEDAAQFKARTAALATQVSSYEVLPGQFVNGQFTLAENIADLGGIAIAYDAYQRSLKGKPAPIIDGLTGDQRFFLAWSQFWRSTYRDAETTRLLKEDSHPPQRVRPYFVRNFDAWYKAFDVKPGDKLYLPPEKRLRIW
jgi:putative endopeptidase